MSLFDLVEEALLTALQIRSERTRLVRLSFFTPPVLRYFLLNLVFPHLVSVVNTRHRYFGLVVNLVSAFAVARRMERRLERTLAEFVKFSF